MVSFIKAHQLTSDQFRGLSILSDQFVQKSLDQGELAEKESYDMGALFRIITQNDQSYFQQSKDLRSELTKDTL